MSAVGDARKRIAGMQSDAPCILTTHADPEEYARIFNEGYEAAMAQHLAGDPSAADDWLAARLAEARAEERERIAQAIEAEASRSSYRDPYEITEAWLDAARIARSEAGA